MLRWFRKTKHIFNKDVDKEKYATKDPISMADELLKDMEEELSHMRQSLNKQTASEKRLKRRLEEANAEADQRETDARQFLMGNDEDSARLALLKKDEVERHITEVQTLLSVAEDHKHELLQHIHDQIAEYDRLQEKKIDLQSKRNQKRTPTVYEVEKTKVQGGADSFIESTTHSEEGVHASLEMSGQKKLSGQNLENISDGEASPEAFPFNKEDPDIETRLQELKKSLKKRD